MMDLPIPLNNYTLSGLFTACIFVLLWVIWMFMQSYKDDKTDSKQKSEKYDNLVEKTLGSLNESMHHVGKALEETAKALTQCSTSNDKMSHVLSENTSLLREVMTLLREFKDRELETLREQLRKSERT